MIRHYLKLAFKNLLKNKVFNFINLFGLICGTLSALIIAKYIGGSKDYDSFHVNVDQIYSIIQKESVKGYPARTSRATYWGIGEIGKQKFPEVLNVARYRPHVESLIISEQDGVNSVSFNEQNIAVADRAFLEVFSFPLIYGDRSTALEETNSIVLTEEIARKYFGDDNPLGQVLTMRLSWGEKSKLKVTGVLQDLPDRTMFKFKILLSQGKVSQNDYWNMPSSQTFFHLEEGTDVELFTKRLSEAVSQEGPIKSADKEITITADHLATVELSKFEMLLAGVGLFILIVSWINFINLWIAQSYGRFKEIGVLRVLGSTRRNLLVQFVFEAAIINGITLLIVISLYWILQKPLIAFTAGHILPLFPDNSNVNILVFGVFILGTMFSTLVPVLVFKSQNFSAALRAGYVGKLGSITLRKVLVIGQFAISAILMISIFVISNQLNYMKEKDKGINLQNTLIIRAPKDGWDNKAERLEVFKQRSSELPFVSSITSSTTIPSEEYRGERYFRLPDSEERSLMFVNGVDDNFLSQYEVELIEGNSFTPDAYWKNKRSILINREAVLKLGLNDLDNLLPIKLVDHNGTTYELIGVTENYHKTSLKNKIRPMAFVFNPNRGHFSIKLHESSFDSPETLKLQIDQLEKAWNGVYHNEPFDYFFLDEKFSSLDQQDYYFGKLFNFFTLLSVLISCMGLFGLSLLVSAKRKKEIGIRKVFGASINTVVMLLIKSYLSALMIAIIVGTPVAYFVMDLWLSNYSYRVSVDLISILMAIGSLAIIFLATISYHTYRASITNPTKTLRNE